MEAVRKKEASSIKVAPQSLPPNTACTALFAVQANSWECMLLLLYLILIAQFILIILQVTLKRKSNKEATTNIQCIQKSHEV